MAKNLVHSPRSPEKVNALDRRIRVLDLRKQHFSLRDIARVVKVSHQTVKNDLDQSLQELSKTEQHKTEEYRMLELQRLERVSHHVLTSALSTDKDGKVSVNLQAVEEYRRLSESRRKLLGLDMPASLKVDATVGGEINANVNSDIGEETMRFIEELRRDS